MNRPVYPIYTQREAIESFLNELTDISVESEKKAHATHEDMKNTVEAGLKASLYKIVEGEIVVSNETAIGTEVGEETVFVLGSEHKANHIRKILRERGTLYDLNTCLTKGRPFGSFVDFRGLASFERVNEFIHVNGHIENINFKMVCSPQAFTSKSFLFQIIRSKQLIGIVGFGVILDFLQVDRMLEIKPLLLAFEAKAFRV